MIYNVIKFIVWSCLLCVIFCCESYAQVSGIPGSIAYFKNLSELHIAQADGSNDQVIWTNPNPSSPYYPGYIDWRPDGGELAFSSGHEVMCSIYFSDIWAIKPDGSGLRRITNSPDCAQLAGMPKGGVTVNVTNTLAGSSIFFLYVAGADTAVQFTLLPGFSTNVFIDNVSDFGNVLQNVVVFDASYTWVLSGAVDVQAGQNVTASGTVTITSTSITLTAKAPRWKHDGSQIAYILGESGPLQVIDPNPLALSTGDALFPPGYSYPARSWDWSPISEDYLIDDAALSGIWLVDGTTLNPTQIIISTSDFARGLQWMPDGSGFVFGYTEDFGSYGNLFHYRMNDGVVTYITNFTDGFVYDPSVSPDGQWISYTREQGGSFDIWVVKIDGSQTWQLASNAGFSSWGPNTVANIGENNPESLPEKFLLEQNYPNPFNPSTIITFSLPENASVDLKIYDTLGQEVRTLISGNLTTGEHTVTWDGRDNYSKVVSSGIYLYTLRVGRDVKSKKMIMLK